MVNLCEVPSFLHGLLEVAVAYFREQYRRLQRVESRVDSHGDAFPGGLPVIPERAHAIRYALSSVNMAPPSPMQPSGFAGRTTW